jgi:membrane protease YdiL (CAAX protease family)
MPLMAQPALALYLVLILPGMQLWRSLRPSTGPKRPRPQRYLSSIREIVLLLLALAVVCWWSGYPPAALGLAAPAGIGLWLLAATAVALLVLYYFGAMRTHKMKPDKRAEAVEKIRHEEGMPRTPEEMRLFAVLVLCIGGGWEVLYRGFLTLALTPWIGVWGAVVVAAVAYGVAHGYQNPKQLILSIVMALLFTTGYVLTNSLWWLMLLHAGLPLITAVSHLKIRSGEAAMPASIQLD